MLWSMDADLLQRSGGISAEILSAKYATIRHAHNWHKICTNIISTSVWRNYFDFPLYLNIYIQKCVLCRFFQIRWEQALPHTHLLSAWWPFISWAINIFTQYDYHYHCCHNDDDHHHNYHHCSELQNVTDPADISV